jgi:hypothetical protein
MEREVDIMNNIGEGIEADGFDELTDPFFGRSKLGERE